MLDHSYDSILRLTDVQGMKLQQIKANEVVKALIQEAFYNFQSLVQTL